VTVAETLNQQSWQLVDKLNREFYGEDCFGYVSPLRVVTSENVKFDRGLRHTFVADYRDQIAYLKIWAGRWPGLVALVHSERRQRRCHQQVFMADCTLPC